jgi:transporter family-2 protein
MNWLYVFLAFAAGAVLPLQALVNAQLGKSTTGALFASFCSFVVGTIVLGTAMLISRSALPSMESALRLPLWMWLGGALGAGFVIIATLGIPRIGASPLVALVVFGQMAAALAYDRFGVLQPVQAISASRLFGALMILAGVLLVLQPWKAR